MRAVPCGYRPGVPEPRVAPAIDRLAAYAWRLLVIAAGGLAVLWLLGRMRVVIFPIVIAVLLTRALVPIADHLRRRALPNALAAALALLAFVGVLAGIIWLIAPAVAEQFSSLGPTVSEALNDVEQWIVEDSGLDVTAADVDRARARLGEQLRSSVNTSSDSIAAGAVVVAEALAGLVIAMFLTFFLLKDGHRFQRWSLSLLPLESRPRAAALATRSWNVIGGYLRGAAILGALEGAIMAVTIAVVGGSLAVPVAVITFLAAFVPFVGAIVAGVISVLVTLASAGLAQAAIVAVVAVVVQQLDNDVLAPLIYGRALQLHPAAIILAVAAGGALFGLAGTFLAVPVAAVIGAIASDLRSDVEPDEVAALPVP
jgi:predicted PurR-regulated permease PerM